MTAFDKLPRFRGNRLAIEVDSSEPWWKPLFDKIAPGGIFRQSSDGRIPDIVCTIEIEGVSKTFILDRGFMEEINYRNGVVSTVFNFIEREFFQ